MYNFRLHSVVSYYFSCSNEKSYLGVYFYDVCTYLFCPECSVFPLHISYKKNYFGVYFYVCLYLIYPEFSVFPLAYLPTECQ
jgi:hypothetical protein